MNNGFTSEEFVKIESILGHAFADRALLVTAFTHETYKSVHGGKSNERLEFLGDSVLQLAVTEMLLKRYNSDEGKLTELRKQYVSRTALEQAEGRANLMPYLRYEGREENIGGKTNSNLFEAVIGALYLDGGLEAAKTFLKKYLEKIETENYKTLLQEYVQDQKRGTPHYAVHEEKGSYVCTVTALGASASGMGATKRRQKPPPLKNYITNS